MQSGTLLSWMGVALENLDLIVHPHYRECVLCTMVRRQLPNCHLLNNLTK